MAPWRTVYDREELEKMNKILYSVIYGVFGAAAVLLTLALGRYVSKGTYMDHNTVMLSGVLVGGLVFLAISGIVRPRRR